ncbi:hypothetical protein HY3_16925 [Hyphomonas pacifica]|uniref:Uncharacterized protein n=1 Tax=Hyphomonas pacifica TaxID=1280941 RepID=A0A062TVU6_9PROT|nr:hypothetical protein HY2_16510 [Hyphomonas pacifica]RAN31238.1 hypothetical protein HY3_16925 [Hyphomonas pacifica]
MSIGGGWYASTQMPKRKNIIHFILNDLARLISSHSVDFEMALIISMPMAYVRMHSYRNSCHDTRPFCPTAVCDPNHNLINALYRTKRKMLSHRPDDVRAIILFYPLTHHCFRRLFQAKRLLREKMGINLYPRRVSGLR